jgi:molecular chaperone DnaK
MAYDRTRQRSSLAAVYDFGGGCFDFCALSMSSGSLTVAASGGDPWLGGDDLDVALAWRVADVFHQRTGVDLRRRMADWQRVRFACEEAKVYLSLVETYDVVVPNVAMQRGRSIDLDVQLTRKELEGLARQAAARSIALCRESIVASGLSARDFTDLLLAGGTAKVPVIREAVREFFGRDPSVGLHPEQAVVLGAAIRAAELEGRRPSWNPPQPTPAPQTAGRTVGLAMSVGETSPIIERSMPLPAVVKRVFSTSHDGQTSLSLDIVEGEHRLTVENRPVGSFNVFGLQPLPAGEGNVEVTFELDARGVLNVTARDLTTGRTFASTFELGRLA